MFFIVVFLLLLKHPRTKLIWCLFLLFGASHFSFSICNTECFPVFTIVDFDYTEAKRANIDWRKQDSETDWVLRFMDVSFTQQQLNESKLQSTISCPVMSCAIIRRVFRSATHQITVMLTAVESHSCTENRNFTRCQCMIEVPLNTSSMLRKLQ